MLILSLTDSLRELDIKKAPFGAFLKFANINREQIQQYHLLKI